MAEAKSVPVLFVSDQIVLPGMVVPIALDDAARAAVDAARATESGTLLIAPRLEDRYPSHGVLATIVQVGRIPGGGTAAVVRGERRAHIGAGASGPGAALWVEVAEVADAEPSDEIRKLAGEYKKLLLAMLQRREAWELVDVVNKLTDPSGLADMAGYASYLTAVQKRQLLETDDVAERLTALIDWTGDQLAEVEVNDKIAEDVREGMEKQQKEFLLRQQLNAIRKELARVSPRVPTITGPALRRPTCRTRSARPRCARSGSWSAPATRAPKAAGSAPGWTPCSTCRGTPGPRTRPTSRPHARFSTPITTGWMTSRTASSSTWR